MCSGALDKDLLFARAGGRAASSRVQGQGIKRPEASYQGPVGPTVQLAGREINTGRPLCPWPSLGLDQPVFHPAGFMKADADSDFLRVSCRLVP